MLHCVVIEIRRHLCCANVFLKFKQTLNDIKSLKINVEEHKFELQIANYRTEILVNKYFSILAGTFSSLTVDAENASFRISIKDIKIPDCVGDCRNCVKINLNENEESSLICKHCDSVLCAAQKYQKIREFPSGAIDVSEFFCHHGPSFKDVLVPTAQDLFYGFEFIVIDREGIEKNTREKKGHIYCKRCLKYLGESMFHGKAAKLWSDSITFSSNTHQMDIFNLKGISAVQQLLLKAIQETSLPSPEPLLRNMHFTKVLMEACFPNRQHQYLLVHILEKNLPVLRNLEDSETFKTSYDNQNIDLKFSQAFKILHRLIATENDDINETPLSSHPLLEYWQQDINILKMKISPFLFSALNKELNTNILLLPEIYRNNDDFLFSYIFY